MKTIGKFLVKKLISLILLVVILVGIFFGVKRLFPNWFTGTVKAEYSFVLKKFEKKSELVVAGAEVETTSNQTFTNDMLAKWPDWTKPITKVFIGRDLEVEIPVKTEFKLVLQDISSDDIKIENGVLTFTTPLKVNVDSQEEGKIKIIDSSSGLIDKAVDVFTASQKAQEFLVEKSEEAIYKTSKSVLNDSDRQEKVAKYSEENLEQLINLNAKDGEELDVQISVDDLEFNIVDPKPKKD